MLEHIFRNINDIRVFDLMVEFDKDDEITVNDMLELLDYREADRIQIEDSVQHLIKEQILDIKQKEVEAVTGCRICKLIDKLKLPRIKSHKAHVPERTEICNIDTYFIKDNDMTRALKTAAFTHITLTLEQYINKKEPEMKT